MSYSALRRSGCKQHRNKGFTLMELLITVVIIGILAGIAYPMYLNRMLETRRSDAQTALTELANRLEKFYYQCNGYNVPSTTNFVPLTGGGISACTGLAYTSTTTPGGYYTLSVDAATGACAVTNCYTLTATPVASGPQSNNGSLQLTSTNIRRWDKNRNSTYEASESTWASH